MGDLKVMVNPLKITRLADYQIKGSFSINCDNRVQFDNIRAIFQTDRANIRFQNIPKVFNRLSYSLDDIVRLWFCDGVVPERVKFVIKYDTLGELLKLREVFKVRAAKFDVYLIKKRGYNPFDGDFHNKFIDTTIQKVLR